MVWNFDGLEPIYPYANLNQCTNLRNILQRGDNRLFDKTINRSRLYFSYRKTDTAAKAIDVEAVFGYDNEPIPIAVTLVNYYGYPLVDTYIYPGAPVKNWATRATGFDSNSWEEMLNEGCTIGTYDEVMDQVDNYSQEDDILVGHNVYSDIKFLDLYTGGLGIEDTQVNSAYKNHGLPRQPGLKRALLRYFNIIIQDGDHDSLEDARASMLLYRSDIE